MRITTQQIIDLKKPKLKEDIIDVLKKRFSSRVFSDDEVDNTDLNSIIESARWAPSSSNRQPWFFYLAKKGSHGFRKTLNSLNESNYWAKHAGYLVIGCYLDEDSIGKNNYAQYDLGQAVMSLVIQAQSLGYYAHQIGGFNKDLLKENIAINHPFFRGL